MSDSEMIRASDLAQNQTLAAGPFALYNHGSEWSAPVPKSKLISLPEYYKSLARLNFEAAKAADNDIGRWPGYEIAAPPPVMVLCAHAIELALKAYLLDKGIDKRALKKLSHNLEKSWVKCVALGADEKSIDVETLGIISDLICTGRLRYGEKSKLGRIPVFGPLSTLCEQCLDLCGAPTKADLLQD